MINVITYTDDSRRVVLSPTNFNMIIGRSGTGKTAWMKSLFSVICHTRTGIPLKEIRQQMVFDANTVIDIQVNHPFDGTVFYIPPCEAYLQGDMPSLPLHLRKTVGVYNSWVKRGVDFDKEVESIFGLSGAHGGLLKTKVFLSILKEISPGDILLVDLPEAGVDATIWKWWIDQMKYLMRENVQIFMTTHDFFVYTYVRASITSGSIFYFTFNDIKQFTMTEGIPESAPILSVPLEVLESAM